MPLSDIRDRPVVLFDFDGTLADTGGAVMRLVDRVLRAHGRAPAHAELGRMIGPPLVDGFRDVFGCSDDEARRLTAEYRALFDREVTPADYPPLPGVPELLEGLRGSGKRLAVATSRMEASGKPMLAAIGLAPYFEAFAGRVDGIRHTKADSIRAALAMLDAAPADAVMVGDRFYDIEGAHEVGMPCIGVYTGGAASGEHDAADAACSSMVEVAGLLGIELR